MRSLLFIAMIISTIFSSCRPGISKLLEPGVSRELALYRVRYISDVHYKLFLDIPADKSQAVTGNIHIDFKQARAQHGVIIDFQAAENHIHWVSANNMPTDYQFINNHIIIPASSIKPGQNQISVSFTSTDQALNRSDDFLYTLVVPDRASTVFPCFDQPDIKATYSLSLQIPEGWTAVANGPEVINENPDPPHVLHFEQNQPISTYLFAFAAGKFEKISETQNGRVITIYHREPDKKKLEQNISQIFDLHFSSLKWLEDYTQITYPFSKFDMVLLPGFQYSGMEHPGAIWYRDNRLLLDEDPPITQRLSRASLIAHETAHMWFGNLVTMEWFDDVWLKEVFAGFMADKIVHPLYPDINHELQFLLTHYPRAYAVDRTRGTHPIKQSLENLKLAGTLYGAIIYNKAPIVFLELEALMGEKNFQQAVREYLQSYYMDNADWDDLAQILDRHSQHDLKAWSRQWIYGTGMPGISTSGMSQETERAAGYLMKHEEFLHQKANARAYMLRLMEHLESEENTQISSYLLGIAQDVFWLFLTESERELLAPGFELLMWEKAEKLPPSDGQIFLDAFAGIAYTSESQQKLIALLKGNVRFPGLEISEDRQFEIIAQLMIRNRYEASGLMERLLSATENPDRIRRINYLLPALNPDQDVRHTFFTSLGNPANRRPEPWALDGLRFLHHPTRRQQSIEWLPGGLNMLEEIQQSGDIFFPLRWLEAMLGRHNSQEAAGMVMEYLESNPQLHPNLQLKVWQAADMTLRAAWFN